MSKVDIPKEVSEICAKLASAGFEAYLVGGCVRDIFINREPKDWDITTNAKPEQVVELFPDSIYENDFGTVLVKPPKSETWNGKSEMEEKKDSISHVAFPIFPVEVTTYRIEGKYSDKRHPDDIKFAKTIDEDLSRRDFTVNAIAMTSEMWNGKSEMEEKKDSISHVAFPITLTDPFNGQVDLKNRIIKTVGKPEERFREDALRLMRAVRFAVELDFEIEPATRQAIEKLSRELEVIAKERIKDELMKILNSPRAAKGIILLEELGLLEFVLPELREGLGVGQNKHHIYGVFEHNIRALDYAAKQNYSLEVRMASLLHDVGKPRSKKGDGPDSTFYQHEYIGAKMVVKMLDRLRFSREFVEKVAHLVRRHMFFYDVGTVTPAGVRRFILRVGPENIDDLIKVREADRIGSGVEQAVSYRLRHFLFMIEKVKHDPITPKMLKINGDEIMVLLKLPEGMRVGWILHSLLEEVLDDPEKNDKDYLTKRTQELNKLSDAELKKLTVEARKKEAEAEKEMEAEIKREFKVK